MSRKIIFILVVIAFALFSKCSEGLENSSEQLENSTEDYAYVDEETDLILHQSLLNIYGEPLQPCRSKGSKDRRGSWNSNGYCDEIGGGVHQICVDVNQTEKFSESTGQGPWSEGRKDKNHCMCLGAWALYKARQNRGEISTTDQELLCDSIMDDALHERYVDNWNTWNGNELNDQIVEGVNELIEQCHENAEKQTQKTHLQNLYLNLTESKPEFHKTSTYLKFSR